MFLHLSILYIYTYIQCLDTIDSRKIQMYISIYIKVYIYKDLHIFIYVYEERDNLCSELWMHKKWLKTVTEKGLQAIFNIHYRIMCAIQVWLLSTDLGRYAFFWWNW